MGSSQVASLVVRPETPAGQLRIIKQLLESDPDAIVVFVGGAVKDYPIPTNESQVVHFGDNVKGSALLPPNAKFVIMPRADYPALKDQCDKLGCRVITATNENCIQSWFKDILNARIKSRGEAERAKTIDFPIRQEATTKLRRDQLYRLMKDLSISPQMSEELIVDMVHDLQREKGITPSSKNGIMRAAKRIFAEPSITKPVETPIGVEDMAALAEIAALLNDEKYAVLLGFAEDLLAEQNREPLTAPA